jgi:hypothetical protein
VLSERAVGPGLLELAQQGIPLGGDPAGRVPVLLLLLGEALLGLAGGMLSAAAQVVGLARLPDDLCGCSLEVVVQPPFFLL